MQPAQGTLQARQPVGAALGRVLALHLGHAVGDLLQRVGQVAVAVQRLHQHVQRNAVLIGQPHAQDLLPQVVLQRGRTAARLGAFAIAVALGAAAAGR